MNRSIDDEYIDYLAQQADNHPDPKVRDAYRTVFTEEVITAYVRHTQMVGDRQSPTTEAQGRDRRIEGPDR